MARFSHTVTTIDKEKGIYHVKRIDHGREATTRTSNAGKIVSVKAVAPSETDWTIKLTKPMIEGLKNAIVKLRKPYLDKATKTLVTPKGILVGQSGLAAAFKQKYDVELAPVQIVLEEAGMLTSRPVWGDVMLYLAADAPTSGRDPETVKAALEALG